MIFPKKCQSQEKGELINGFPILGTTRKLNLWKTELYVVIAIGDPVVRKKVVSKIKNNLVIYPTLIHPTAIIGAPDFVTYGKGCILCAGNILTTNIKMGDFVILNLSCTVGHDTVINDYVACMPSVNISGEVTIGEGVYLGTGAKIINQLEIGEYTIVGAGAVISKALPAHCTAVGVPAKPIKFHK